MDEVGRKRVAQELRRQYLGELRKPKKHIFRASDKSRFCSDWPLSEDTSADAPALIEAPLLFGRGFRAGFDRLQQKKEQIKASTSATSLISHWSDKKVSDMTPRDWRIFQEDFDISYKGFHLNRPHPMRNWDESGLSHGLLKAVQKSGYKKPTPIQMAAIPIGLAHRDAIGVAATGSGKTASFVLPMLNHIASLTPLPSVAEADAQGPHALVLAPTRELAGQIAEETSKLSRYLNIRVILIVGGHSIENQGVQASCGCDIIVATPGRLIDCLERRFVVLNQCNYVVLDEADRMVSMGFEEQLVSILNSLPCSTEHSSTLNRMTCMFSATMPSAVESIARRFLRDPVTINVGARMTKHAITQRVVMVQKETEKLEKLRTLIDGHNSNDLIMIFVNTVDSAYNLLGKLQQLGYGATTLNGKCMSQEQREASLRGFKSGHYQCLVATNVVARGIDIQGVTHVVNYDMPPNIEEYTHRIGRTGRAGNSGFATTFLTFSHDDQAIFYDLRQFLIESNNPVPPELARHEASKFKPGTFRL